MSAPASLPPRIFFRITTYFATLIFVGWSPSNAVGGASDIVRIEEDWTLNVSSPEQGIVAPQLATVISPLPHTNSYYAVFAVNHRALPDFAGGGLQLQLWKDESAEQYTNYSDDSMLNYQEAQETISWTQAVEVKDGVLTFEILNGSSQTWGQFGGGSDLRVSTPTSLTDLNQYSPVVSVSNSGISYAANRVRWLTINKIRLITASGQVTEFSYLMVVYQRGSKR